MIAVNVFVFAAAFVTPHPLLNLPVDTSGAIPPVIRMELKGIAVAKVSFEDRIGEHLLILSRASDNGPLGRRISLIASQYLLERDNAKKEWTIKDFQDCGQLDLTAEFYPLLTSITDLDSNGIDETAIVYHKNCTGDVEPDTVKAIMRQNREKFAIRGESLLKFAGFPAEGGSFTADPGLNAKPAFKSFLISKWKEAAGVSK